MKYDGDMRSDINYKKQPSKSPET